MRIRWRKRHSIVAMLLAMSGLAVAGVWAWLHRVMAAGEAEGINPIALTVRANGLAYEATWAYVTGVLVVHGLVGAWARYRGDREAWIGVVSSAVVHAIGLVLLGVIAPPG